MTSGGAFSPAFANTTEKLIATIMILLSGVFWSQLIGVLCGIAANLSPATQAFRKEMGELNNFMNNNPGLLDQPTRYRLREYLHQSVHVKNIAAQKNILGQLSPGLHSPQRGGVEGDRAVAQRREVSARRREGAARGVRTAP